MSETRVINGRVYTVTEVPQEDVDEVKEREGVSGYVGKRLLVNSRRSASNPGGRTAPKYIIEV